MRLLEGIAKGTRLNAINMFLINLNKKPINCNLALNPNISREIQLIIARSDCIDSKVRLSMNDNLSKKASSILYKDDNFVEYQWYFMKDNNVY